MAHVDTFGGTFSTDAPGKYEENADSTGIDIHLEFQPNELVESAQIGFIQTANTVRNGAPEALRPEIADRSTTAEEGDEGAHIDRAAGNANPMYGTNNLPAGSTDMSTSTSNGNTHFGSRVKQPDGSFLTDNAWLEDGPANDWNPGETGRQTFESTALCLEGPMSGTYLGSVSWGYDIAADGNITLRPLAVVSQGVPSSVFMTSATKWNDATVDDATGTGTELDTLDVPTTAHVTTDPAGLSDIDLERRMRELHSEMRALTESDDPTTFRNIRFEIRALGREAVIRGDRVVDSGHVRTISPGDTLWELAHTHLGRGTLWVQIFALNAAELQHGDRIAAGGELKMPEPYQPS